MRIGDLYAVICIIFISNFKNVIEENQLRKLSKKWIIVNENPQNKKGHEFWENGLNDDYELIKQDFINLQNAFDISFFKLTCQTDLTLFYEKCRYEKPFKELSSTHSANMFAFLSAILKQDKDAKMHDLLIVYLAKYFMPSFNALSSYIISNSKSNYFKALGYFLDDFCFSLKEILRLKN